MLNFPYKLNSLSLKLEDNRHFGDKFLFTAKKRYKETWLKVYWDPELRMIRTTWEAFRIFFLSTNQRFHYSHFLIWLIVLFDLNFNSETINLCKPIYFYPFQYLSQDTPSFINNAINLVNTAYRHLSKHRHNQLPSLLSFFGCTTVCLVWWNKAE